MISISANDDGKVIIREADGPQIPAGQTPKRKIVVPTPNHDIDYPISFQKASEMPNRVVAGPKGMKLSEMYANSELKAMVPNGLILPFGYFNRYLEETGIKPLVELLGRIKITDEMVISILSTRI